MRRCAMWEKRWAFLTKGTRNFNDVYADVGPSSSIRQFVGKRKLGCLKHVARRREEAPGLAVPPFGSRLGFGERRSGEGGGLADRSSERAQPFLHCYRALDGRHLRGAGNVVKDVRRFLGGREVGVIGDIRTCLQETQRPQVEKLA